MWETGVCDFAAVGWFWIIPLAFMTLCIIMMLAGHSRGSMMNCMDMGRHNHSRTDAQGGESAADIARRRYASGEMGREDFQRVISDTGGE